jgi:hypothetical protein
VPIRRPAVNPRAVRPITGVVITSHAKDDPVFPSPYLNHLLDDAHRSDLLKLMDPHTSAGSHTFAHARAAVARLVVHFGRAA